MIACGVTCILNERDKLHQASNADCLTRQRIGKQRKTKQGKAKQSKAREGIARQNKIR